MKLFGAFLLAVGLATALPSQKLHPLSDEYIQEINNKQSTWKAGRNFKMEDWELFKSLATGLKKSNKPRIAMKVHIEDEPIPDSFDAREAWPECADVIGLVRDQSRCGACWAFAAAEAMSDRICIHSGATRKTLVSSQSVLTCSLTGGCNGGWLDIPWITWASSGFVTGGLYNHTEQGCQSYFLPTCEDHPHQCTNYVSTPACSKKCDDASLNYNSELTYGKNVVSLSGEKQIQLEILKNGPVEAAMDVYEDFANYKSGIYQRTPSNYLGGHAIKILGWGEENGIKYWLVANSWNERWGENGYFRILRGKNEADIEGSISAGLPDFSKF